MAQCVVCLLLTGMALQPRPVLGEAEGVSLPSSATTAHASHHS